MNHKVDRKPPKSGKLGRVFLGGSLALNIAQARENDSLKKELKEVEKKWAEERAKNSKLSDENSKLSDQNWKLLWDNIALKEAETRATAALNQKTRLAEAKDKEIERLKAKKKAKKTVQPESPMKTS
jgi:hypothetical protein